MNLQEQTYRIREMMGIIVEDNDRRISLVLNLFDEVFDNLYLVRTYDDVVQINFVDKKTGKKVFERNNWGTFWIYDCEIFDHLRVLITSFLRFDQEDEFERLLISYLNNRYKKEFESRPIKVINTEGCE